MMVYINLKSENSQGVLVLHGLDLPVSLGLLPKVRPVPAQAVQSQVFLHTIEAFAEIKIKNTVYVTKCPALFENSIGGSSNLIGGKISLGLGISDV
jgi:hypothetical protein